jgi:hypothetical protein
MYIYIYIYMYIYICIYIYIYIYPYVYTYIYIYIYIYIYTPLRHSVTTSILSQPYVIYMYINTTLYDMYVYIHNPI